MDKKLVIVLSIVAIAMVWCYVAIIINNRVLVDDLANSINYDEQQIGETMNLTGINSATWDQFEPFVYPQKGLDEADKIDQFPGQPIVSFRQYSGYVTVETKRDLFYYFAESSKRPTARPLVLWLTGSIGCSSLIEVMMGLGPYRVLSDSATLGLNPYAWNNVANVLFLETPTGVGFSHSDNKADYDNVGYKMIARDSYTFLINWLERFPVYKNREFYIAGDTYAGYYASQLARIILHMNKKENHTMVINLRGIVVENAMLDETCGTLGYYEFLYKHKIISMSLMVTLQMCYYHSRVENIGTATRLKCASASNELAAKENSPILQALDNPTCDSSSIKPHTVSSKNWTFDPYTFDPCTQDYIATYLNKDQVREALHAKKIQWLNCSDSIMDFKDNEVTVLLALKELMASGIRVWLYSGENEAVQTPDAIHYAVEALKLKVKTNEYTWYNAPNEIGGLVAEYYNMTFVTVKGVANHIPSYAPAKALMIFSSFLEGKPLPGASLKLK